MGLNLSHDTLFSIYISLKVALLATFLVTIIGSFLAYLMATRNFKGKIFAEILISFPLILPPTVTGYYLIIIFGRNGFLGKMIADLFDGWTLMFSWWGAVLASFVVALPLMVKTAQAAIESVDKSMIDTSYMLGYSETQTALKVVFPIAKKGILAGVVLSFARAMGEFGATLMIAGNIPGKTNTMPLEIYSLAGSGDWKQAHLLVLILTLTSAFFLFWSSKLRGIK